MFEKKEDKVFGYVFGDLDAQDAQIFEANMLKDEISAEEVRYLQSMKDDLASFRDIPEMQYSKERLRHAILGQGLKPTRPGFSWLNWVLAPGAAACVFALGYVMMNGTNRKDPTYIGAPTVANGSVSGGLVLPKQDLKKPEPMVATNTKPEPTDKEIYASGGGPGPRITKYVSEGIQWSPRKRSKRTSSGSPMLAMKTSEKISASLKDSSAIAPAGAGGGGGSISGNPEMTMPGSAALTSAPSIDATMILIDKDQDSGVGSPVATEVNDTRNVVIGG